MIETLKRKYVGKFYRVALERYDDDWCHSIHVMIIDDRYCNPVYEYFETLEDAEVFYNGIKKVSDCKKYMEC